MGKSRRPWLRVSSICWGETRALREECERLRGLLRRDELTGLLNRQGTLDELERWDAQWTAVYLDVDDFKSLNDQLGHFGADDVLRSIGASLQAIASARLGIAGRLGGDEFVVCLPGYFNELATARLLHTIRGGLEVRVSIGVARGASGAYEVLREADVAMYVDKRSRYRQGTQRPGGHRC